MSYETLVKCKIENEGHTYTVWETFYGNEDTVKPNRITAFSPYAVVPLINQYSTTHIGLPSQLQVKLPGWKMTSPMLGNNGGGNSLNCTKSLSQ